MLNEHLISDILINATKSEIKRIDMFLSKHLVFQTKTSNTQILIQRYAFATLIDKY